MTMRPAAGLGTNATLATHSGYRLLEADATHIEEVLALLADEPFNGRANLSKLAESRWLRKFGQLDKWRPCFTISVAGPNTGARA